MKKKLKKAKVGLTVINVKMGLTDKKILTKKAKAFANGNLSAWLRYTGQNYRPKKGEVVLLEVNK